MIEKVTTGRAERDSVLIGHREISNYREFGDCRGAGHLIVGAAENEEVSESSPMADKPDGVDESVLASA